MSIHSSPPPGFRLVRPLALRLGSETWVARLKGRRVVAKRYPPQERKKGWPAPPDPAVLRAFHHFNLQRFLDFFEDEEGAVVQLFKWMEGRSLLESCKQGSPLDAADCRDLSYQIASALRWIHERCRVAPRIHGNVSPGNILRCARGRFRLLDALALQSGRFPAGPDVIVGTLPYVAPEVLAGQPPRLPSDVFSAGMVVLEASLGGLPWKRTDSPKQVARSWVRTPPAGFPRRIRNWSSPEKDCLAAMLDADPLSRPQARELCRVFRIS